MKKITYAVFGVILLLLGANSFAQSCGTCNWYGTNYPVCCDTTSGWGWENSASCVSSQTCTSNGQTLTGVDFGCGVSSDGFPICCGSYENPDDDEWGWQNNQSCKVENNGGGDSGGGNSGGGGSCNETNECPSSFSCPNGMECGCYTVDGLGANKRAYVAAGANRSFLASAMMETERMDTNYTYGDGKVNDAFNAGATKQNWGMMRQCHSAWTGLSASDYATSDAMNSDRALDVEVYFDCRNHFGDSWFAGHRNGSSGLANPNTPDIQRFIDGYNWTYNQIQNHQCNDVRFWVQIPAI